MNITVICEDTFDGIMTAIYDGWVLMREGNSIKIHPGLSYEIGFFSEYKEIKTDERKASQVASSIRVRISVPAYMAVYRACMHYDEEKANKILKFLTVGYRVGAKVMKMYGEKAVMDMLEINRKVANEAHLFKGFVRFEEIKGGILYSEIEPKCNVITLLAYHFEDRFPEEKFIIYDSKRKLSCIHDIGKETILVVDRDMNQMTKDLKYSDDYNELWRLFFNTIGIDSRYNPKCQMTQLPKWFRKNMTEFKGN